MRRVEGKVDLLELVVDSSELGSADTYSLQLGQSAANLVLVNH